MDRIYIEFLKNPTYLIYSSLFSLLLTFFLPIRSSEISGLESLSDILESLEIIMVTGTLILVGYTAIQITKGSKTNMKIVIGAVILSIPPLISIRGRYPPPYTYWSIDYAFKIGFYLYLLGLLLIIIGGWRGSQLNSFNDD